MRVVGKKIPDPPKDKREFAALAYRKGWWIYCRNTEKWYSPEEFMETAVFFNPDRQQEDFGIHDPGIGVMEQFRVLERMVQEFGEFMRRVNRYYERKPRRERK